MDIGKSFTYVFEDPNWIMKVLIGGVVSAIPIVNFAALGYMVTTLKNVADGQPQPLPEWSNFGDHFMKGLYVFVGALIYVSPIILLYCCMFAISAVLPAAGGAAGRDAANALGTLAGLLGLCLSCLIFIVAIAVAVLFPAALVRFAMSNQLSTFWDFRGTFDLVRANLTNYIIALLIAWIAGFVAGFGVILCVIGVIFTSFWAQLVGAHVFGQFWQTNKGVVTA
ncbi:MAG: DUF4013 domain-containing protein [Anaerolineae bacterium]|nr:DUF4013 domain-containing protein [Anaerolineae bacterium]